VERREIRIEKIGKEISPEEVVTKEWRLMSKMFDAALKGAGVAEQLIAELTEDAPGNWERKIRAIATVVEATVALTTSALSVMETMSVIAGEEEVAEIGEIGEEEKR